MGRLRRIGTLEGWLRSMGMLGGWSRADRCRECGRLEGCFRGFALGKSTIVSDVPENCVNFYWWMIGKN